MKENEFFFLKNLGTFKVHMQKYSKNTSTQKVSGTSTAPFLEYLCFIVWKLEHCSYIFNVVSLERKNKKCLLL
jgi:hypothetical protein